MINNSYDRYHCLPRGNSVAWIINYGKYTFRYGFIDKFNLCNELRLYPISSQ